MVATSSVRVQIDPQSCEGHGLCVQLAPDVFDLGDDEIAACSEQPDRSDLDVVKAAVAACPRQAISLTEIP
ncbi:ferredoxin [Mycobacterium sp. OTB74]|uniref:ferredoxin n=1 Tax=Mycobacterium sp. OTB74 TaxID=1853452 RepID=UPI0024762210|nr:ferredoxin [Mycobacterium sp. OTB74]MDH6247744.1 ferredoxin [Mycobacterium sp. OTB74]